MGLLSPPKMQHDGVIDRAQCAMPFAGDPKAPLEAHIHEGGDSAQWIQKDVSIGTTTILCFSYTLLLRI